MVFVLPHHVVLLNFRKGMSAIPAVPTAIIAPFSVKIAPAAILHDCYSASYVFPVVLMDTMPAIILIASHA
jgi:hypothetical protein